jgi:hypothetical protein
VSDRPFLTRILLACSRGPVRLFRNNVGQGWVGKSERVTRPAQVMVYPGDVVIRKARPLHAGLFEGSGDLIGWETREIRAEHVGQRWAVFVSLEAKEGTGRLSPAQRTWREQVAAAGGVAAEVRSVDDAQAALFQNQNGVIPDSA